MEEIFTYTLLTGLAAISIKYFNRGLISLIAAPMAMTTIILLAMMLYEGYSRWVYIGFFTVYGSLFLLWTVFYFLRWLWVKSKQADKN